MTDNEVLLRILEKMESVEKNIGTLSLDVSGLKEDTASLRADVSGLKEDTASLKADVSGLKEDTANLQANVSEMKEDMSIVKEDSNITRTAVNKLLDWADDASIQIVPLFKKAK